MPIIPDEARTFGMESLFRQFGIYASQGQLYKPHDADMFLYYKEAKDGQILEEGITEAGSMASFTAAGTAYANYGVQMIPFFIYYSMFGFQRVGDLIWAFADARGKGFLWAAPPAAPPCWAKACSTRTATARFCASTVPTCVTYDPAFAYEIAIIVQDGIRRMYQEQEDRFYYLTLYNENYAMPTMPEGVDGRHPARASIAIRAAEGGKATVQSVRQRSDPERSACARSRSWPRSTRFAPDVWSVTSYNELRRDAVETLEPPPPRSAARSPYILQALKGAEARSSPPPTMKVVPDQLAPWLPDRLVSLGTDGFGRSDNREHLRRHFEINAESIAAPRLSRSSPATGSMTEESQEGYSRTWD